MIAAAMCPAGAFAATFDFEGLASDPQRTTLASSILTPDDIQSSGGFEFSSAQTVYAYGALNSNNAITRSGSVSLNVQCGCHDGGSASLSLRKLDGASFNLESVRVAEGRANAFSAFGSTALEMLGTFGDGSTISYTHVFDGIANSDGATDFEALFLSGFEGITALQFTGRCGANDGYSFGIDGLVLSDGISGQSLTPVPLPAGFPLLLLSLGCLMYHRKKTS